MIKTKTIIRRVTKAGKTKTFFSDAIRGMLQSTRRYLSDLVFGVAITCGITPKKLAKNLTKDKVESFGKQLSEAVASERDSTVKKEKKVLESTGATVKAKRGRPRKS